MANALYAQSGGVTAVINASACGVIETAKKYNDKIDNIFIGRNGIVGVLKEELYDGNALTEHEVAALRYCPGGAFGSCRYKLSDPTAQQAEYQRLFEVFSAHDIRYFFYNGGGDSQDTTHKISQMAKEKGYPLQCIGIPKTIDNDLPITDNSPGFGSVAKYVATSIREAGLDIASMAETSTKVFIMEVMGRHAGWIAAASGLASEKPGQPPHIILFPEILLDTDYFLAEVTRCVNTYGYCTIVASEGIKDKSSNRFISDSGIRDAFGHAQLGGVAPALGQMIKDRLGYKFHWAVCDYLQRSARHIAAKTDVDQAYAVGEAAVKFALDGVNDIMVVITRKSNSPYQWTIDKVTLSQVANVEQKMPSHYISDNQLHITDACRQYLSPLIIGEDPPKYKNGIPDYQQPTLKLITPSLKAFSV